MKTGRDKAPSNENEKTTKTGHTTPGSGSRRKEPYTYEQMTQCYEQLEERLGEHAYNVFGPDGPVLALDEFLGWPEVDEPMEADFLDRQGALFWPWFLFNWEYDSDGADFELDGPTGKTVAELYMDHLDTEPDPLETQLIRSTNRTPFSFLEVTAVIPGKSINFRDILTGREISAEDRTGSQTVQPADIVFGRVSMIQGVGLIIGIGTTILPPGEMESILRLRQKMLGKKRKLTNRELRDWNVEMRRFYFATEQALFNPPEAGNEGIEAAAAVKPALGKPEAEE